MAPIKSVLAIGFAAAAICPARADKGLASFHGGGRLDMIDSGTILVSIERQ
jgi:hypothetical protein